VLSQINLDVTFPHLACGVVSLDAMDVSGEQHLDVAHNIFKRRIDEGGVPVATAGPRRRCPPRCRKPFDS
jgi:hypothetical protein